MALTIHATIETAHGGDCEACIAHFVKKARDLSANVNEVHVTDADDWSVHVDHCPGHGTCTGPAATA